MSIQYTQNTTSCKSMKLRMVIGGWTDYYVNHSDDQAAFNVHGKRVNVEDSTEDYIVFRWDFNVLRTSVGEIIKAMSLVDDWLKVE